jgi:hypothetical protein
VTDHAASSGVARLFLRWSAARSCTFRGYWLVTSFYLVVSADLSPFQLVVLGTAMELAVLVAEVPTGVVADTLSRRWSIVISHVVMGAGMVATGLSTAFPVLVVSQVVWGVGWTFASGADVAWVTDELADGTVAATTLTARARWDQLGALAGMGVFGGLAWATDLGIAIVVSGGAMAVLGLVVASRFREHGFTPTREHRWRESRDILRRGATLARRDPEILLVFAAVAVVSFGSEAFDRLQARRLVDLGLPEDPPPVVWFTALGVVSLLAGAFALRAVERHVHGEGGSRRLFTVGAFVATAGILLLAHAPEELSGMAGIVVTGGVSWPVLRAVSVVWVNRRSESGVRATVQSFLGQMESAGEILGGLTLGAVAQAGSVPVALTCSAVLLAGAGVLVWRSPVGRRAVSAPAVAPGISVP